MKRKDFFIVDRIKRKDYGRIWHEWHEKAKEYHRLVKLAKQEKPPAINTLWVGILQALVLRERAILDKAEKLVNGNVSKDSLNSLIGFALCYMDFKKEGVFRLKRSVEISPTTENMRYLALVLGERDETTEQLKLALKILEKKEDDLATLLVASGVLIQFHRHNDAEPYVKKALNIMPKAYLFIKEHGDILLARGQYRDALVKYEKAVQYGAKSNYIWGFVALCSLFTGKLRKAKKAAEKEYSINPDSIYGKPVLDELEDRRSLGLEYFFYKYDPITHGFLKFESTRKNINKRAAVYYAASEALRAKNPQSICNSDKHTDWGLSEEIPLSVFGCIKCSLGIIEEGLCDLRKAVEIKTTALTVANLLASLDRPEDASERKRWEKHLISILEKSGFENQDEYNALWAFVIDEENAETLLKLYSKVCQVHPDHSGYYLRIANCLCQIKKFEEAIRYYKKCREIHTGNPIKTTLGIAQCYLTMGKIDEARKFIADAKIEAPSSNELKEFLLAHPDI